MYFDVDIVNILDSQAKPSVILPFPRRGGEPAAPAGAKPTLQLSPLQCHGAHPQNPRRWGDCGGSSTKGKATRLGDTKGETKRGRASASHREALGAKTPFWVPTTQLLFSFTNLVIKKKSICAF